jgi:hypothetical protein
VLGWGGAFTGAAAANFWKLSDAQRQQVHVQCPLVAGVSVPLKERRASRHPSDACRLRFRVGWRGMQVLRAYWGDGSDGGNAYTLGRVPIGSCDFDPESYTFDDVANDTALQHFDRNVTHDQRQLLPFIRAAQRSVSQRGRSLRVLGSPWSPPAWMKVGAPPPPQLRLSLGPSRWPACTPRHPPSRSHRRHPVLSLHSGGNLHHTRRRLCVGGTCTQLHQTTLRPTFGIVFPSQVPVEGVQSVLSSAKPNGLLPQFQSAWARYLSLWVTAYEAQGIPVWGITAQV